MALTACLHDHKKWLFGGPAFVQPIRTKQLETVSKSSDWLEKIRPFKNASLFLDMKI